ncbi:MAG: oxaloacetate decarboxylase [Chloroflexi bacterium]|nr:oxaloacetate decarboxylase [Chloroflexota bacterium]
MTGSAPARLRALLARPGLVVLPGASDALGARLVQAAGFPAVYATGAGIANTLLGLPDLGLATMSEVLDQVRRMVDAVEIPLVADVDTGYGNPLNVRRTVRAFECAGVAGLQMEDQVSPKRCGHFSGKDVIPMDEMVLKLRAAVDARRDPALLLIARTDALAVQGIDEALRRARRYLEAGADALFVEAPTSREEMARIAREVPALHLANMTEGGKTPILSAADLEALGFKIALYPNTLLRSALRAGQAALKRLYDERSSLAFADDLLLPWHERQRLVGLPEYEALEQRFVRGE